MADTAIAGSHRDCAMKAGMQITSLWNVSGNERGLRCGWTMPPCRLSPAALQAVGGLDDPILWLTALSSPGLTAYTALDLFGRCLPPQPLLK